MNRTRQENTQCVSLSFTPLLTDHKTNV